MNIYAIYVNSLLANGSFVSVRQGFSRQAAILNFFWAIYHKMWLVVFLTALANILVMQPLIGRFMTEIILSAQLIIFLVFGWFGADFKEYSLQQKGYVLSDIVVASSTMEAEVKFLTRQHSALSS